jgi:hypothetical protein
MPKRTQFSEAEREQRRAADRAFVQQAVEQLRSSDGWQRWLTTRRHFHSYTLLIWRAVSSTARSGAAAVDDMSLAPVGPAKRTAAGIRQPQSRQPRYPREARHGTLFPVEQRKQGRGSPVLPSGETRCVASPVRSVRAPTPRRVRGWRNPGKPGAVRGAGARPALGSRHVTAAVGALRLFRSPRPDFGLVTGVEDLEPTFASGSERSEVICQSRHSRARSQGCRRSGSAWDESDRAELPREVRRGCPTPGSRQAPNLRWPSRSRGTGANR